VDLKKIHKDSCAFGVAAEVLTVRCWGCDSVPTPGPRAIECPIPDRSPSAKRDLKTELKPVFALPLPRRRADVRPPPVRLRGNARWASLPASSATRQGRRAWACPLADQHRPDAQSLSIIRRDAEPISSQRSGCAGDNNRTKPGGTLHSRIGIPWLRDRQAAH
jgi:hypothetical protein